MLIRLIEFVLMANAIDDSNTSKDCDALSTKTKPLLAVRFLSFKTKLFF